MVYIFFVLFLFVASVTAHIYFCRNTHKPGLHAKAFIVTATIALGLYTLAVIMPITASLFDPRSLWGMPFKFTAGIVFILLVPIYLCFYVLTQLQSPSKIILLAVSQAGEASYDDIVSSVQAQDFIMTRLNDLCISGCVQEMNGRYVLTSEGRKIAGILDFMQLVLGRKAGG